MSASQQNWDSKCLADFRSVESRGRQDGPIFQQIAPDFRELVIPAELTPKLFSRGMLTPDEYQMMSNETTPRMTKNIQLLQLLQSKGTEALNLLYLSILDTYESVLGKGLSGHYELARRLRQLVRKQAGINTEKEDAEMKDPCSIVDKLPSVRMTEEESAIFTSRLGLGSETCALRDVQKICQCWLRSKGKECTMESLVQALLFTRGLGYLVSGMLPPSYCNPPEVYNFIQKLGLFTGHLASYLGYSPEHISTIIIACRNVPENRWIHFLREWQMPDCGAQCTSSTLAQVAICGNLQYQLRDAQQKAVPFPAAGNQLQAGSSPLLMQMQLIVNMQSPGQGASNLALPSATLKQGSDLSMKMIEQLPPISHNIPHQESEEMDGPNQSLPHHANAAHFLECSQGHKHVQKRDSDLHQDKHSQSLPEQISEPKQHSTNVPQTTGPQREAQLPPFLERSESIQQPARKEAGSDAYDLLGAARNNDWELVEGLAESGTFPDTSLQDGKTALMYACMQGRTQVVKRLVEKGASVSTADNGGKTPLMYACISGKLDLVKLLVRKDADVSARDHNGECCLHFPETLKNLKLMESLVQVFTLLDCSHDIPSLAKKYTPLMVACTIGDDVALTIKLLLESGVNQNGNSEALNRPLVVASGCGSMRVVQELLNHSADPNIQDASGTTALLKACQNKQPNMAAFLIERGANVDLSDHDGTTPLFAAVTTNSFVLIQRLIQKGAKVNTTRVVTNPVMFGSVEETPLSHACARGFLDITEYLIQNNADVNYLCGGTVSPLGHAIILNHMHIVKFLLKNKNLDTSPYGLSTSIIIAVKMDKYDCAGWLLEKLGGAEAALQRAQQNGMFELEEHVQIYRAAENSMLQPPQRGDASPFPMSGSSHMLSIMHRFCALSVEAVVNNPDPPMPIENLPAIAAASGQDKIGRFLQECISKTQNPETLLSDLLDGDPSAFKFLTQNNILTLENFQIQVIDKCEKPQQFCAELVDTVHQLPDGKRLPQDPQLVLQHIFSGNMNMTFGATTGAQFNPFAQTVGGIPMKQHHGYKPTEPWRQSSFNPPKEKKQEQSQWGRSVSDSAYTGGWQVDPFAPAVGGSPMKPEQKHNLGRQTSLPVKEREQKQRSWKKSISDSASSGGATRQTGATTSQRETDHHESSDPSTVPSDTQTWQEIRTLRPFIKQAKLTDKVLGQGAYGSVIEVEVKGEIYAGKKLRADACSKDPVKFRKQFYTEYQVLDKLEHDHIVRYLGLAIMSDSDPPILIMEKLMTNLEVFITNPPREYGVPNFPLKLSFLTGIANGLSYLHSKGVIHRDLTATNILLDRQLVAKISDFGNSAIVDIEPTSHLQTKSCVPGTLSYMPPEACDASSRYNNKLDVFSFGHLSLFVVTGQQMKSLLPSTFKDRKVPGGIAGRSEVERRREYIDRLYQIIEREHPLVTLIINCLQNFEDERPTAKAVFTELVKISNIR